MSQIPLTEVLYSLKVEYTLVSISHLNEIGFITIFSNKKCIICDSRSSQK